MEKSEPKTRTGENAETSPESARQANSILAKLWPEKERRLAVAKLFAGSIQVANAVASTSWNLIFDQANARLKLNVGPVRLINSGANDVWICCKVGASLARVTGIIEQTEGSYAPKNTGGIETTGWVVSLSDNVQFPSQLVSRHHLLVAATAKARPKSNHSRFHCEQVVHEIEALLGHGITEAARATPSHLGPASADAGIGTRPSPSTLDNATSINDRYETSVKKTARPEQAAFRQSLLKAYGGRCAITQTACEEALEAAHIQPVEDEGSDAVENGLLLRADVHSLFDKHLLTIDPHTSTVVVNSKVVDPAYRSLHGKPLASPSHPALAPSNAALQRRFTTNPIANADD